MKLRLWHDPFDVAPHARRHSTLAWVLLASGVLVLAAGSWRAWFAMQAATQQQAAHAEAVAQHRAISRASATLQTTGTSKEAEKLLQAFRLPWFGLFAALETAVAETQARVTVLSLVPAVADARTVQVQLVAVAADPAAMVAFLRAVQAQPGVARADLAASESEDSVGPRALRFQLDVVLAPESVRRPAPAAAEPAVQARRVGFQ